MFLIDTPRLMLRDLQGADLLPFFALGSNTAVLRYQTFIRVETIQQAAHWLEGAAFHNAAVPRAAYNLAIVRKEDGRWLGWIGAGQPERGGPGEMDFGYALLPQFWGQGYMGEALRGLVDYCFTHLTVTRMFGECERENHASARVMQKAGLRLRDAFCEPGQEGGQAKNMLRYAITREEWQQRVNSAPGQSPSLTTD